MVMLSQLEEIIKLWRNDYTLTYGFQKHVLKAILDFNKRGEVACVSDVVKATGLEEKTVTLLLEGLSHAMYLREGGTYQNAQYELTYVGRQVFESEYEIKTNLVRQIKILKEKHPAFEYIWLTNIALGSGLGRHSITKFYLKGLEKQNVVVFKKDIVACNGLKDGAKLTATGDALVDYLANGIRMKQ